MKLPNNQTKYRTGSLGTLTLTGLSLLWAVMLGIISPWWLGGALPLLLAGYSNEVTERNNSTKF